MSVSRYMQLAVYYKLLTVLGGVYATPFTSSLGVSKFLRNFLRRLGVYTTMFVCKY